MGTQNVSAAFSIYAGKVSPTALLVLVFMALGTRDDDPDPWYGRGHEVIAIHALGRPEPVTKTDLRAVERAFTELHAAKAVTVERHGARRRRDGYTTARYRLNLSPAPTPDGKRRVSDDATPDGKRRVSDSNTRRKVVPTPDGKRRTEEYSRSTSFMAGVDQSPTGSRGTPPGLIKTAKTELQKRTGRLVEDAWAEQTARFILGFALEAPRDPIAYVRDTIRKDPNPSRFVPTPQPGYVNGRPRADAFPRDASLNASGDEPVLNASSPAVPAPANAPPSWRDVPCPVCNADTGKFCRNPVNGDKTSTHPERLRAAASQGTSEADQ